MSYLFASFALRQGGLWVVAVLAGVGLGLSGVGSTNAADGGQDEANKAPPTRQITHGPKHHWFGYYDKLQFDPTGRYVLTNQVDFEHRSPTADDVIQVGMIDLHDGNRWIELGESRAWNWQQGCMLQWLPGSESEILWNDRQEDRFVCHIMDVFTKEKRTIPHPVYSVSPDGKFAVSTDFRRIQDLRPGYGYAGLTDPHADELKPDDSWVIRVNLETGEAKQLYSVKQIAELGELPADDTGAKHYFNHLLVNPDGTRFIALHRWAYPEGGVLKGRLTRLITANMDGSDIRVVIPTGYISHFIWKDPRTILANSRNLLGERGTQWHNYLFSDREGGGSIELVGQEKLYGGGHVTYVPRTGDQWILNDTYPQGKGRFQTPHLYHVPTDRRIDLGAFHSPPEYTGEWRVDTHPRTSRDGNFVCIDGIHPEEGRQLYLIEIREITAE